MELLGLLSVVGYGTKYHSTVVSTVASFFGSFLFESQLENRLYRLRIFVVALQVNCGLVY
jgi:hypothetical protein